MAEETVCPTTASSPDVVVRGILAAGLEEAKDLLIHIDKLGKLLGCNQIATYLLLVACEELLRFLTTDRASFGCPAWVSTLELLASRVVPVPFDESTVMKGTVRPTTASSPDAEVRGILAAGLEKEKIQIKTSKSKVLDCNQLATSCR